MVILQITFPELKHTAFMRDLQAACTLAMVEFGLLSKHIEKWVKWESDTTPLSLLDTDQNVPRKLRLRVYELISSDQAKSIAQRIINLSKLKGLTGRIKVEIRDKPQTQIIQAEKITLFPQFKRLLS